jgi:hypothetical protein
MFGLAATEAPWSLAGTNPTKLTTNSITIMASATWARKIFQLSSILSWKRQAPLKSSTSATLVELCRHSKALPKIQLTSTRRCTALTCWHLVSLFRIRCSKTKPQPSVMNSARCLPGICLTSTENHGMYDTKDWLALERHHCCALCYSLYSQQKSLQLQSQSTSTCLRVSLRVK